MPVQVDMGGFLFGFNHVGLFAFVYLVNRCCFYCRKSCRLYSVLSAWMIVVIIQVTSDILY